MKERAEAMVLASFAADSHALGAHLLYDGAEIASRYGRVERLLPPPPDSPYSGRPLGSPTWYGEQALEMMRFLAKTRRFDAELFASERAAREPARYVETWPELAPIVRVAPIVYLHRDNLAELIRVAHLQAEDAPASIGHAAAFLTRLLWIVLNGNAPSAALRTLLAQECDANIATLVEAGVASRSEETAGAATRFGQGGELDSVLPLAMHLVAKYEGSLRTALVENVAAGGCSAARGMIVAMILGAFHGHDSIPDEWTDDLLAYREVSARLENIEEAVHQKVADPSSNSPATGS